MATPDYTSYTHADLLARVTSLEAQLRAHNIASTLPSTAPSAYKKPKKAPKPFDPTRYNHRFIALKFAYLGGVYNGFEHHTNNATPLPTIEEVLWKALRKTRLIFPEFKDGQSEDEVFWEGVEYSKCGRTDKGVSAFGQVIGLRVRSSRPKEKRKETAEEDAQGGGGQTGDKGTTGVSDSAGPNGYVVAGGATSSKNAPNASPQSQTWNPIRDEHPYIQLLNRVLPSDIRILAWCPHPPPDFSARFSCRERRYRYFFTNPAYACASNISNNTTHTNPSEGHLNIATMQEAASKLEGLHDFRNFCKVDPGKQITNFERRIFHAGIHAVDAPSIGNGDNQARNTNVTSFQAPTLYYFEVRGSAFLWHQVRHLVAVLFLVGQGYELPSIVDSLLDIEANPGKPAYEMADDRPLVLWECIFPDLEELKTHSIDGHSDRSVDDTLDWVYVGDPTGGRDGAKRVIPGLDDGLFGRNGIMDDLWALWRMRKIDEVLASSLMDVVLRQNRGNASPPETVNGSASPASAAESRVEERSDRVFDGSDTPRLVGKYVPLMQRKQTEAPAVMNARYAARKGLMPRLNGRSERESVDADE